MHEPEQDIICDFVAGHAFGDTIGVGLRSVVPGGGRWWTVSGVSGMNETQVRSQFILSPEQESSSPRYLCRTPLPFLSLTQSA